MIPSWILYWGRGGEAIKNIIGTTDKSLIWTVD